MHLIYPDVAYLESLVCQVKQRKKREVVPFSRINLFQKNLSYVTPQRWSLFFDQTGRFGGQRWR